MDTWNYAECIVLNWIQRYVAIDVAIDSFLCHIFFDPSNFLCYSETGWYEVHLIKIHLWHKKITRTYSGITCSRVLNRQLLYTEIPEVSLFVFEYRLFHKRFHEIFMKTVCRWCMNTYQKAILDLDPDLCQNFLFFLTSSILHIETCIIPLSKAVHKGFISFSYT